MPAPQSSTHDESQQTLKKGSLENSRWPRGAVTLRHLSSPYVLKKMGAKQKPCFALRLGKSQGYNFLRLSFRITGRSVHFNSWSDYGLE